MKECVIEEPLGVSAIPVDLVKVVCWNTQLQTDIVPLVGNEGKVILELLHA